MWRQAADFKNSGVDDGALRQGTGASKSSEFSTSAICGQGLHAAADGVCTNRFVFAKEVAGLRHWNFLKRSGVLPSLFAALVQEACKERQFLQLSIPSEATFLHCLILSIVQ